MKTGSKFAFDGNVAGTSKSRAIELTPPRFKEPPQIRSPDKLNSRRLTPFAMAPCVPLRSPARPCIVLVLVCSLRRPLRGRSPASPFGRGRALFRASLPSSSLPLGRGGAGCRLPKNRPGCSGGGHSPLSIAAAVLWLALLLHLCSTGSLARWFLQNKNLRLNFYIRSHSE